MRHTARRQRSRVLPVRPQAEAILAEMRGVRTSREACVAGSEDREMIKPHVRAAGGSDHGWTDYGRSTIAPPEPPRIRSARASAARARG
jgi:hypothetical protein